MSLATESSNGDYNPGTPPELCKASEEVTRNILPEKSRKAYDKSYESFMAWRKLKKADSFSKRVISAYFRQLSKSWKPTTLWSEYSKLRSTLKVKHDVNIDFPELKTFFKRLEEESVGKKKANTFSAKEIERFFSEAPDDRWLATKVAAIFGFLGACRREELKKITTDDIKVFFEEKDREKKNPMICVTIWKTRTGKPRLFTVEGVYHEIYKKYADLRAEVTQRKEFFVNFQKGRCTNQVIGINKLGAMPKTIAKFLKLDNPEKYTGHAFRRTSATLLVEGRPDITSFKRVAEGYVESSKFQKRKMYCAIKSAMNINAPSTLTSATSRNLDSSNKDEERTNESTSSRPSPTAAFEVRPKITCVRQELLTSRDESVPTEQESAALSNIDRIQRDTPFSTDSPEQPIEIKIEPGLTVLQSEEDREQFFDKIWRGEIEIQLPNEKWALHKFDCYTFKTLAFSKFYHDGEMISSYTNILLINRCGKITVQIENEGLKNVVDIGLSVEALMSCIKDTDVEKHLPMNIPNATFH